jgi:hypothetical protein
MFFRNQKPHEWTLEERLATLKPLRFEVQRQGAGALVTRDGCGAQVEDLGVGKMKIDKTGILVNGEIATLVNHGYQMFLTTPSGKELPAQADHLKALHAFDEDLREGLGVTSLYNLSLGTTTTDHLYDRLEERDAPVKPRPWQTIAAQHSQR